MYDRERMLKEIERIFGKGDTFTVELLHRKETVKYIEEIEDAHKKASKCKLIFKYS